MNHAVRPDGGEPDGVVSGADFLDVHASLKLLCKDLGDFLERTYEGWGWIIRPDERGGIIDILSLRLSGRLGIRIRTAELQNDPARKSLKEFAGQLLERYGMPRVPFLRARDHYNAAERDPLGDLIPDLQDKTPRQRYHTRQRAIRAAVAAGKARFVEKDGRRIVVVSRRDVT